MTARRLLVTGGAGFIGANFVHRWCARNPDDRVVVVDALTYAGNRATLRSIDDNPCFRFVEADITELTTMREILHEEAIDTVVHFAAESHVDRSIEGPGEFVRTNLVGTWTLLEAARGEWIEARPREHRFHHVSTDEVYGSLDADDPAFSETTRYEPNSPYAASKAGSDHLVRAYLHTYGLQVTTSNCSNNYGPYQFPEKLIPLMIVNLLDGKELPVYGDGLNVRDWLHVEDHCAGIERILERGQVGETYNVGGDNEWRNIDLVNLLCRLVDGEFASDAALARQFPDCVAASGGNCADKIRFVRDRPGHDRRYAIDGSKLRRELVFTASTPFEDGLRATLRWYLGNEDWWRAILDGSYREWVAKQYQE
ncbi:MAG TPA: dTDP-glucose 4,6-dehydratase [Acidobacteriota bacterium]|nr:dTDP-glucose 4,6-dehydratase [Acidobacteriota bacterium]